MLKSRGICASGSTLGCLAYNVNGKLGKSGLPAWVRGHAVTQEGALVWHRLYREWYALIKGIIKGARDPDGCSVPGISNGTGNGPNAPKITMVMRAMLARYMKSRGAATGPQAQRAAGKGGKTTKKKGKQPEVWKHIVAPEAWTKNKAWLPNRKRILKASSVDAVH